MTCGQQSLSSQGCSGTDYYRPCCWEKQKATIQHSSCYCGDGLACYYEGGRWSYIYKAKQTKINRVCVQRLMMLREC